MKRVLLVDSDAQWVDSLAQAVTFEKGWEVLPSANVADALNILSHTPCDAVVTALQLPGASGPKFLNEVMQRYPQVHRMVLSDLKDRQVLLKCIGTAHQFLSKPCDGKRLAAALDRAFSYDCWLPTQAVQNVMSRMVKLPSPPNLFFQIVKEMQAPDASLERIGALIQRDIAITAKLLQLVNSAAFGLEQPISNAFEALSYVGLETTRSMVLLAHCFSNFDTVKNTDFSADRLWDHSLRVGVLAKAIARAEDLPLRMVETSFTAGMLHDLGKLALVANLPKEFTEAVALSRQEKLPLNEAETRIIGASHAEVGACLLAIWGLVPEIVEALAFHHSPAKISNKLFRPLTTVYVADALEHALLSGGEPSLDTQYLEEIGVTERLPVWKEICARELDRTGAQLAAA